MRYPILILAAAACLAHAPVAFSQSQSVYFREAFNSGPPQYGFGWVWPNSSQFTLSHLTNGGADGSGAGHLRTRAGADQYSLGWATRGLGRAFSVGDSVYIRFRVRFDEDHRWAGSGSLQNKFLMMGLTRTATQSRIIVHNERPHSTSGCTLGFNGDGGPTRWLPRDFGMNYDSWDSPAIAGLWGSLSVKVNIGWDCTPPVPVTRGVWYHVQIYARSGLNNNAEFKIWVNNDNFDSPSARKTGINLGVDGWSDGLSIGGYQTDAPTTDGGFRLDDLEVGNTFDQAWSKGSGPAPEPPTNVRAD